MNAEAPNRNALLREIFWASLLTLVLFVAVLFSQEGAGGENVSGGGQWLVLFGGLALYLLPLPIAYLAVKSGLDKAVLVGGLVAFGAFLAVRWIAPAEPLFAAESAGFLLVFGVGPAWILGYGIGRTKHGTETALMLSAFALMILLLEWITARLTGGLSSITAEVLGAARQIASLPSEAGGVDPEILARSAEFVLRLRPVLTVFWAMERGFVLVILASVIFSWLGLKKRVWVGRLSLLRLPDFFVWVLLAAMVALAVHTQSPLPEGLFTVVLNVLFFAAGLYLIQGLAVILFFARGILPFWVMAILLYLIFTLILISPQVSLGVLTLLGVLDVFFDFRRRIIIIPPSPPGDGTQGEG